MILRTARARRAPPPWALRGHHLFKPTSNRVHTLLGVLGVEARRTGEAAHSRVDDTDRLSRRQVEGAVHSRTQHSRHWQARDRRDVLPLQTKPASSQKDPAPSSRSRRKQHATSAGVKGHDKTDIGLVVANPQAVDKCCRLVAQSKG